MKYYAVHKGKKPGIYNTWEDCKKQIDGFSGPIYKKFEKSIPKESDLIYLEYFGRKPVESWA